MFDRRNTERKRQIMMQYMHDDTEFMDLECTPTTCEPLSNVDNEEDVVEENSGIEGYEENVVIEETPHTSSGEVVGTIYGKAGTTYFDCRVSAEHLERSEYVSVVHDDYGPVLCQVGTLVRKSNLTLEDANDADINKIDDVVSAHVDVIGYRDNRGLLMSPRTTFRAGSKVTRADQDLVKSILGLKINPKTDGYIGLLHGHGIPVALNINELIQRHACILAKTGGGKSYMSGDIIEELMKQNVTCMIIDPHGE